MQFSSFLSILKINNFKQRFKIILIVGPWIVLKSESTLSKLQNPKKIAQCINRIWRLVWFEIFLHYTKPHYSNELHKPLWKETQMNTMLQLQNLQIVFQLRQLFEYFLLDLLEQSPNSYSNLFEHCLHLIHKLKYF